MDGRNSEGGITTAAAAAGTELSPCARMSSLRLLLFRLPVVTTSSLIHLAPSCPCASRAWSRSGSRCAAVSVFAQASFHVVEAGDQALGSSSAAASTQHSSTVLSTRHHHSRELTFTSERGSRLEVQHGAAPTQLPSVSSRCAL